MQQQKILALSSSRVGESGYLETALPAIRQLLGPEKVQIAFIPFASVDDDDEAYTALVRGGLQSLPYEVQVVSHGTGRAVLESADVIMVGGGNTFKLLHDLYSEDLLELIGEKINSGTPYVGWSAGANILGPTIGTTNDMPVIQPRSFAALSVFPFQLNPHYTNALPAGHRGETRDQRLQEFVKMNPSKKIIALPEGTGLLMQDGVLQLTGEGRAWLFAKDEDTVLKKEIAPQSLLTEHLT